MATTTKGTLIENPKAKFIDLSYANKITDWSKIKAQVDKKEFDFIILRCGYRGYSVGNIITKHNGYGDKKFLENFTACNEYNIPFGLYFLSQAINEKEAIEEAKYCVKAYIDSKASLPIFIDCEHSAGVEKVKQDDGSIVKKYIGRADHISSDVRTACAKAFCDYVHSCGIQAGVYSSTNWYKEHKNSEFLNYRELVEDNQYLIWCADYGVNDGDPHTQPPFDKYDFWQYTSSATVAGIENDVDMNISYIDMETLLKKYPTKMERIMEKYKELMKQCEAGNRNSCYAASRLFKCILGVYLKQAEKVQQ